jgi:predicted ATP-dependent protease
VCKARGLKGTEGVIIPEQNVADLMLDEEVVQAVAGKKFHIYPVRTVDEGISILTGLPAGKPSKKGIYPKGSVNRIVADSLAAMLEQWKAHGKERSDK